MVVSAIPWRGGGGPELFLAAPSELSEMTPNLRDNVDRPGSFRILTAVGKLDWRL
jgi:hypothetical protein